MHRSWSQGRVNRRALDCARWETGTSPPDGGMTSNMTRNEVLCRHFRRAESSQYQKESPIDADVPVEPGLIVPWSWFEESVSRVPGHGRLHRRSDRPLSA